MTTYESDREQPYRVSYATHKRTGLPMIIFSRIEDEKDVDEFALILTSSKQAEAIARLCAKAKILLEKLEGGELTWPKDLQ